MNIELGYEPGWTGAFTRNQAGGALPNGTRIVKAGSEEGDATQNGSPGVVLGSLSHPNHWEGAICYFIEWDDRPKVAVACMAFKVQPASLGRDETQ